MNNVVSAKDLARVPIRKWGRYDPIVTTTVFHWFTSDTGNLQGPWPPLGGRASWTGDSAWWKDQIKQMMLANIDIIYVHLIAQHEAQRITLFRAHAELLADGYDPPKIAPFLDPFGIWAAATPSVTLDAGSSSGKDAFAAQYIRFYQQYLAENTGPLASAGLARIEDKLVVATWWVVHILKDLHKLTRKDVESRLADAFKALPDIFGKGLWMVSTALIDPDLTFSDERAVMFTGLLYCVQSIHNSVRTYHLQGGYWDQNIRRPGFFMPRLGGDIYRNIWDYVIDVVGAEAHRIYIESWNEYDEGSGIYAADPHGPFISEYNLLRNQDRWSKTDDPFEYIRTTHKGASRFNKLPQYDAMVLGHKCESSAQRGDIWNVVFLVRNCGNALWMKENVGFGVHPSSQAFHSAPPLTVDADENETARFGGVFRGRPVTFMAAFNAPADKGTYTVVMGMFQMIEGQRQWFGQQVTVRVIIT